MLLASYWARSQTTVTGGRLLFSFETLASSLGPHPSLALLLVEVGPGPRRLEQARAVLAQLGVEEAQIQRLSPEEPVVLLVRIPPDLGRRVVLALSENGFTRLKSIYPARPPAASGEGASLQGQPNVDEDEK